jgi:cytochrome c5
MSNRHVIKEYCIRGCFIGFAVIILLTSNRAFSQDNNDVWRVSPRLAKQENPIPVSENSIASGKIIYERDCLQCHGKTGKAMAKWPLFSAKKWPT